jgi:hypothetical protein
MSELNEGFDIAVNSIQIITFVLGFNHYILGRLISDCSITSINDIVFVFDHIQLKIIIAFDNLLQIKYHFSLNLKQVPNSIKKILIWLNI